MRCKDGEIDDEQTHHGHQEGVAAEAAGLGVAAEDIADSRGGAGEPANDHGTDEELIQEVDDGRERVLEDLDDPGVNFIEVELVAKQWDVERVLVLA